MGKDKLKRIRQEVGFSVKQLSRYLDVSERTIYRWEEGRFAIPKMAELAINFYYIEYLKALEDDQKDAH